MLVPLFPLLPTVYKLEFFIYTSIVDIVVYRYTTSTYVPIYRHRETDREKHIQTYIQAGSRHAYTVTDRQTGRQAGRQKDMQKCRQARQADRQMVRQMDRQTDRQAERQTDRQMERRRERYSGNT